jgi:hypothetical protein
MAAHSWGLAKVLQIEDGCVGEKNSRSPHL